MKKRGTTKRRTTTAIRVRVLGETWHVPRGFGRVYERVAAADLALVYEPRRSSLYLLRIVQIASPSVSRTRT